MPFPPLPPLPPVNPPGASTHFSRGTGNRPTPPALLLKPAPSPSAYGFIDPPELVPEPASLAILGTALAAFGFLRRRQPAA